MESEKVKEIKKALEYAIQVGLDKFSLGASLSDCLTLINELESENKELNNELKIYKMEWLNGEKMHLQGELEYTEFELSCANEMCSTLSKLYDEAEEKLKKYNEFNNNLIVENQKLKDELTIERKETAEKIISLLKEKGNIITEFDWNDYLKIDVDDFTKIAKQFNVEIKE